MSKTDHSKKNKIEADRVASAISSIDFSDDALSRVEASLKKDILRAGSNPFIAGESAERSDFPECDACGSEGTGMLRCSRCESAFYCGKDCQKFAWKEKGHKLACPTMKEDCRRTGKEIVALLNGPDPPFEKVARLEELDGEGAYASAVKSGLHCALRKIMLEEAKEIKLRYRKGGLEAISCTQNFVCTLFRGQRVSRFGYTTFSKLDSVRVSGYLASSDDAFTILLDSAIAMIEAVKDRMLLRKAFNHRHMHSSARDVWAAFSMIFARKRMSRAVLFGPSVAKKNKGAEDSAAVRDRVHFIGSRFRYALKLVGDSDEKQDPNSVIEANVNQVAAMISLRCEEFGIPVDFDGLLKLGRMQLQMYQQMAKPLALGNIQKGAICNNQDAKRILSGNAT